MTTEKSQKITIEVQARITIDGIEPNMPFLSTLANAVMDSKQTVIDATPQKPKEVLPQQQPMDIQPNRELPSQQAEPSFRANTRKQYGSKDEKPLTVKQIDYLKFLADEGRINPSQICVKYKVPDITKLNNSQAQEIFKEEKRKRENISDDDF